MTDKGEVENSQISDQVLAEVKGPDPEVWGQDADRPQATDDGLGIGEIRNEGQENERKGPGQEWATDEEGNYTNRREG